MTFDPTECSFVRAAASAMIDGELDASDCRRVEQHLPSCSACTNYRDELLCLKQAVHGIRVPEAPSERLWQTITTQMGADAGPSPDATSPTVLPSRWRFRFRASRSDALVAAAAFVLGLGLSILVPRLITQPGQGSIGQGVPSRLPPVALAVGDFVRENATGSPPEGFLARFAALDSWRGAAESQLDFRPSVPDTLPGGYRLVGVKLLKDKCCYTIYLHYESAGGALDVFQCHNDHPVEFGAVEAQRGSSDGIAYTSLLWDESGTEGRVLIRDDVNIIVVGALDEQIADAVTREFRNAND